MERVWSKSWHSAVHEDRQKSRSLAPFGVGSEGGTPADYKGLWMGQAVIDLEQGGRGCEEGGLLLALKKLRHCVHMSTCLVGGRNKE
jgi:hypothetical protein